uniref:Serine/threonine-protein phosphatase 4 regulatory subunit 4 n=1 Tax=Meloidogyne floridensis TaxID=298350 RepID=A0A915NPH8_9BILA
MPPTKSSTENISQENNKEEQENELKENNNNTNNKSSSLDALYAAAREEFDLDLSPTESAIKTLKEGREIQKLNVVRNLGELFENEPNETIEKIIPLIQEILNIEPSNLDMHCEAAIVYKNCIKDRKLRIKCPELPEILLNATLENIEIQKENVTAAAWLESLVDISEAVSQRSVISVIVPLAVAQSDSSRRVQRRIISTRLIEKLAALVPKEINSADSSSLLLPCIIELCKDEDPAVREATLGTLDDCLPHFSKESKKSILSPLLHKCAEQALIMRDSSLPLIAKHLGVWLQSMKEIISGPSEMHSKNKPLSTNNTNTFSTNGCIHNNAGSAASFEHLRTCCRRMCAYNFPCIVSVFGQDQQLFCQKLLPILERFCRDPDEEVRSTVASGFHEVLAQRNCFFEGASTENLKSKQNEQQPQLLNSFVELLSSSNGSSETEKLQTKLNQLIINCNSLLRGTGFWRAHESYLNSIASLKNLLSIREIKQNFVPLLKQEVLNAKALPCRVAAANSLLLLMRQLPISSDRLDIVKFFIEGLGQHLSCYRRRLLLDIVPTLLHNFSREFFVEQFLPAILKLSLDPISNIRLQLCRTLSTIRRYLVFPKDDECLSSLERTVRDLLASEQNPLSRQLIQQFACELSRTESDKKECRANRTKLAEEKKLWTEVEEKEEKEEEKKVEVKDEIKIKEINKVKEEFKEEEKIKEIPKKVLIKKKKQRERETGSPESGIFIDEEEENKQKNKEEGNGLLRSATTTNVPVHVLDPPSKHTSAQIPHSLSSDTIAQLAAYKSTSKPPSSSSSPSIPPPVPPKPNRCPPPPTELSLPPPTSSSSVGTGGWRRNFPSSSYSSPTFSVNSSSPKMAIIRPQPQVTVVQRACSPMPSGDRKTNYSSMIGLERGNSRDNGAVRENSVGGTYSRNSRLPLSTARYRSNTPTTTPNTQVQHLANKFMGSGGDGTEPVTDSLRLNKYKPRNSVSTYSSSSSSNSSPKINTKIQTMSRSASALPPPSTTRNRRSVSPGINILSQNSLQTSASYSSISAAAACQNSGNGVRIIQQQQTQRRPYGLMRVQSTSSAVERKPAQIRCQVISMN